MKDTKQIRKVLYIGKSDIALVVFETIKENKNILFAHQTPVESSNLKVKITDLLTYAANFLGFNIKDVELIFDDSQITRYGCTNAEFVDCSSEEEISKEIFKKAKIDNYFVNEINFLGINYDEIDKIAKVNYKVCASDYITYKTYINVVKQCNVKITNSTNLYKLLKANKQEIELSVKINNGKAIACEYYGKHLNNVKIIDLNLEQIKQNICSKFNININKVDETLDILKELSESDNTDVTVINNYYLKTKTYNEVRASDIISFYKKEIKNQIGMNVDFRNFQYVEVISDNKLNALDEFGFATIQTNDFGNISLDKIICLANIDMNKDEINQFVFEGKIQSFNIVA